MSPDLESYYARYYRDVLGLPDWRERVRERLNCEKEEGYTRWLDERVDLRGKRALDVGCSTGGLVLTIGLRGADAVGLEPDGEAIRVASRRVPGRVVRGVGQALPFREAVFDVVVLMSVLEHTPTPREILQEVVRILRPGGRLWLTVPNHIRWTENHYRIFWPPYLPRPLARVYLRLRGKPTAYLDHIYYRNPFTIRKMLRGLPVRIRDTRKEFLEDKLKRPDTINTPRIRSIARWITRIRAVEFVVRLRLILGEEVNWLLVKEGGPGPPPGGEMSLMRTPPRLTASEGHEQDIALVS